MNKRFLACAVLCALLLSVPSHAVLSPYSTPSPTVVSRAEGSVVNPAKTEPVRFLPSNSEYSSRQNQLSFSITNQSKEDITLTGQGSLEVERAANKYYIVPRRNTSTMSAQDSGILPQSIGKVIAPGETCLVAMEVGHYRPLSPYGSESPLREGRYRAALTMQTASGEPFEWASVPFWMVSGEAQTKANSVTLSTGRTAYAPKTKQITYNFANHTIGEIVCNGNVKLQKRYGERWKDITDAKTDALVLQAIASGETIEGVMTLGTPLTEGTYRVTAEMDGLNFVSGQFTVSGNDRMKIAIVPTEVSVNWYALGEEKRVKKSWWAQTEANRDIWLYENNLHDGQSAPMALLREIEAFTEGVEPIGYKKDIVVEVTFWDTKGSNVTASIFSNNNGTYCLMNGKWYQNGDVNVLSRLRKTIDASASI